MLGFSRDACRLAASRVHIMDAASLFASYQLTIPEPTFTVPEVLEEVKDPSSRSALQISLSTERLKVINPTQESMARVLKVARELGEHGKLSLTDLKLLALALDFKEACRKEVIIYTDDYSVQNIALKLRLRIVGIKRLTMRWVRHLRYRCPSCGKVYQDPGTCPTCGTTLVPVPLKRRTSKH